MRLPTLVLSCALGLAACKQTDKSAPPTAKASETVLGVDLEKSLPDKGVEGTTDKTIEFDRGRAEAWYEKGSEKVAKLSVVDTLDDPARRERYKSAKDEISGHPLLSAGDESSVLVADRFEVTCSSAKLDDAARERWLEKIDYGRLTELK